MKQQYASGVVPSKAATNQRKTAGIAHSLRQLLLVTLLLSASTGWVRAQVTTPENLSVTNITTSCAELSWQGTHDSYVLQYRPWYSAGDDVIATGTMTTYTYDLSAYSGIGSVAIRHYDVTNMFKLLVDDIVVKNAAGATVFSENFESCEGNMPAAFTNMDLDGDGYVWQITQNPPSNVNGKYGIASASYVNYHGAVTPDNWLIISNIELGGSISFNARGQDNSYPAENFAVYVSTESSVVEVSVNGTAFTVTGLEPNTPYAWQVKGISGGEESQFASAFFKTKDDALVFATNGDWNDVANWKDADGNAIAALPTNDNRVRIDANATITAGVVAYAGKTMINGGSITIEDGGQLKHKSATLDVTMKKNVTGYDHGGNYCLFASPFSGRTKLTYDAVWSNLTGATNGAYDLYAFDATAANEWINYEKSPTHLSFQGEDNGNPGLVYGEGYLYANQENTVLTFTGTTSLSCNNTITTSAIFNAASTDAFNGWELVGNPFACNGTVSFVNSNDEILDATFYKMNAAGDGFDAYENFVVLAPGEGAFIKYSQSGTIKYSSEVAQDSPTSVAAVGLPALPLHGLATHQDASCIELVDNGTNNSALISAADGQVTNVRLSGRTLYKDGEWNTICLPFEVSDSDANADDIAIGGGDGISFTGTPFEGAIAKTLADSRIENSVVRLSFSETPLTTLEAGKPYIVKWENTEGTIVNPVFNNVTINATTDHAISMEGVVDFVGYYDALRLTPNPTADNPGDFAAEVVDNIYYMTAGSVLKHTGVNRLLYACRAYFDFSALTSGARKFILDFGEGETTGISLIPCPSPTDEGSWYNVSGMKFDKQPTRKGVYIQNGRKVVIK